MKVAILQVATVLLQTFGKLNFLSALVTFSETQEEAPTALLTVGFWSFFGLLCVNALYPLGLLMFPDAAWARIGAALMDAGLDLGYILTYLGMVPWHCLGSKLQTCQKCSDSSRIENLGYLGTLICCCLHLGLEGDCGHDELEGDPGILGQFRPRLDVAI